MSLKRLIDVGVVSQLLKKNIINKEGVRILDCTYDQSLVAKKPDWKHFKNELYGNFEKILALPSTSKELYLSGHIPKAPHISIDAALYPSEYERFALYPPEVFQQYIQMLGIHEDEHLILYARGMFGGMLHASKFAWLFKSYGHEKVSLIDGGFDEWERKGQEISKDDVKLPPGNWKAKDNLTRYNIKYEHLEEQHGDRKYIEWTDDINWLDSRVRGQFEGTVPTGCPPTVVGTHIPGFKNLPAAELVEEGVTRSPEEIKDWLDTHGFRADRPTVIMCNVGLQAAMLAYAIESVYPHNPIQVYNGSLREMELRNPKRVSGVTENV
ncbi:unnamed protein product [Nippostrongylus brasiliensis]|uniref:Putative thiosulfate sulfurtransferase (inferred by orthology to a C. elegans protein) n=1 Tax=Nippostrongylus brasiliensis TaxID=27835 RepID=A0A0N4XXF2_NIPBR|nr:unnamed protein product [Nippostrongylus brasiliensis]